MFAALAPVLSERAILTDAGSTKQDVVNAARYSWERPRRTLRR
jgi:prephenate dehydrogenase